MGDTVKLGKPVEFNPFSNQQATQQDIQGVDVGIASLPQPNADTPDVTSAQTGFGDSFQNFLAVMATTDPKGLQDIIVKNMRGAEAGTDKNGNPFVVIDGKPYYTNQPGLSGTDVAGFVGDIAKFIPASKIAGLAENFAVRSGLAGIGTGLTSLASQFTAKLMGSDQPISYGQAGLEGAFGAGGQAVGDVIGSFVRNSRPVQDASGNFTPEFQKAVSEIGIDLNAVGQAGRKALMDAYQNLGKQFGREARNITSSANVADSSIRLTKGQAAGDVRQMALEEAMRNGARGGLAQRIMQRFDKAQTEDIANVTGKVQESEFMPKGVSPLANQQEAGGLLYEQLRSKAGQMKKAGSDAYEAVNSQDLRVMTESFGDLTSRVRNEFMASGRVLNKSLTPSAYEAAQDIKNLAPESGVATIKDVSLKQLEATRRRLNSYYSAAANDADRDAVRVMQNQFDAWLDDAVTDGLIRGDAGELDKLKDARSLWAKYKGAFKVNPKAADADAAKVIEKITTKDLQPHEVMNMLYGSADIGNAAVAQRVAARLKSVYGADSLEFKRLQEAAFLRIMKDTQGGLRSPQKVVSTIDELVMGKGSGLTRELFTGDQISAIRKMRSDLAKTIVPAEAKNPSKTGYEVARLFEDMATRIGLGGAALNAAQGDLATTGLLAGVAGIKQLRNAGKAYAATRPVKSPNFPSYGSVFSGASAAAVEPIQGLLSTSGRAGTR